MSANWFIAFPMQVEGMPPLEPPPRVRVFGAPDLHVTVAFLGAVTQDAAARAWAHVGDFGVFQAVEGSFSGVEPLGHPRKPSALSAIVEEGRHALGSMIGETRTTFLDAAGARPDTRPPLPHMTLARIQRRATTPERREAIRWAESLDLGGVRFRVDSMALYTWSDDRREQLFRIVEQRPLVPNDG